MNCVLPLELVYFCAIRWSYSVINNIRIALLLKWHWAVAVVEEEKPLIELDAQEERDILVVG
jgi:hypothetical protein